MNSFSVWQWIIIILVGVIYGVPTARILRRAGRSRLWTIVAFIPLVNLVGFWVFAFTRWPTAPDSN